VLQEQGTGSFRLEVLQVGGCASVFFFQTTAINVAVDLMELTQSFCSDSVQIDVLNPQIVNDDNSQFILELYLGSNPDFDVEAPQEIQDPNDTSIDYGTFIINRPSDPTITAQPYTIVARPDITGFENTGCVFAETETVLFINPIIEVSRVEATCFIDDTNTTGPGQDESRANIIVDVSGFNADDIIYTYQLINTATNQEVERSTLDEGNFTQHIFTDVDPELNYIVRVFPRSQSPISITDPIQPDNENCFLQSEEILGQVLPEFTGSISIDKMPSCTPGQLTINITSPDSNFDLSEVDFSVVELISLNGVGPGRTIAFDDIENQVGGIDENIDVEGEDETNTFFFDLENIDTLTLQLSIAGIRAYNSRNTRR